MDIGQIWNQGVVGSLAFALHWLNAALLGLGLATPWLSSWALTIIIFTVIIKLVTLPLTVKQLRSSKAMQDMQPKLSALQKQYGKDKEKLMQEQMALYKEHNINPAMGCLPMLVQMPIWIGLYQALFSLASSMQNSQFFWIASLAAPEIHGVAAILAFPPAIPILALVTGATQWVVQKMMTPHTTDPQQQMTQSVMQLMPLMFVFFSLSVPAGLVLYWVTSNLFSMVQQYFITGWGSLRPAPATVAAAAPVRRAEPKPAVGSPASVVALPEPNGHTSEVDAMKRAIPQAPPNARKRRRRNH